jgi:polyphenol oxidase
MSETDTLAVWPDTLIGWHWRDRYLVCDLLSQWKHGFFTRFYNPLLPAQLQTNLETETAYRLKQVHGDRLISISDILPEQLIEADAIYTNIPQSSSNSVSSIWVCSADCVPLLIGDRVLGTVAAIHAGWRGTAARIVPKIITQFHDQGSQLEDLVVALGPAISGSAYQVKEEVAEQVLKTVTKTVGITSDPEPGHLRLDIRLVQQQQLLESGLNLNQIAIAPYCTHNNPDLFFSYRRQSLANLRTENFKQNESQSQNRQLTKSELESSQPEKIDPTEPTNLTEPTDSELTEPPTKNRIQWSGISTEILSAIKS